jgi:hypothetical protein
MKMYYKKEKYIFLKFNSIIIHEKVKNLHLTSFNFHFREKKNKNQISKWIK